MDVDLSAVGGAGSGAARERAGLSQRDVEARSGISQSMLHRVETGKADQRDPRRVRPASAGACCRFWMSCCTGSAVETRVLAARADERFAPVIR